MDLYFTSKSFVLSAHLSSHHLDNTPVSPTLILLNAHLSHILFILNALLSHHHPNSTFSSLIFFLLSAPLNSHLLDNAHFDPISFPF